MSSWKTAHLQTLSNQECVNVWFYMVCCTKHGVDVSRLKIMYI